MAELFPSFTVTQTQYDKAVWGFCRRFGYGYDEDGNVDPAQPWCNPGETATTEMVTFYEANVYLPIKGIYLAEKNRWNIEQLGTESF